MAARRKRYYRSYKSSTQEKRIACRDKKYVRAKRNFKNCPDAWSNDTWRKTNHSSWKDRTKRRHQWRNNKSRKEITIPFCRYEHVESLREKGYFVLEKSVPCSVCSKIFCWRCHGIPKKLIIYWK